MLALALAAGSTAASAQERGYVYTRESAVLDSGSSELDWWSTFRLGRQRYFSRLDGRLGIEHGLGKGLELGLYWNFYGQTADVVQDPVTDEIERVSSSELMGASLEASYQMTDATTDALGSALQLFATLGTESSEVGLRLVADRRVGGLGVAANLNGTLQLEPLRGDAGTEVRSAFLLEPTLAAGYRLSQGVTLGLELRAPLTLSGEPESATLFGGPVLSVAQRGYWAALGVQPQLVAFSGQSPDSSLDLGSHERVEVRLLAGFLL
jgi:hypothetical protein